VKILSQGFKFTEAIKLADQFELDLVEIFNAEPPVCKIMDYKKFVYEQKKRDKILKAKSTQVVVKEIVLVLKQMSMIMSLKGRTPKNS
jgi:translation initiation factor IF-3